MAAPRSKFNFVAGRVKNKVKASHLRTIPMTSPDWPASDSIGLVSVPQPPQCFFGTPEKAEFARSTHGYIVDSCSLVLYTCEDATGRWRCTGTRVKPRLFSYAENHQRSSAFACLERQGAFVLLPGSPLMAVSKLDA